MPDPVTVEWSLLRRRGRCGSPAATAATAAGGPALGRVPRITRLMALAIKIEGLIRQGVLRDYADVARLGLVSRARVTQIMNLLNLAPDIQEQILFLPVTLKPKIAERNLRRLSGIVVWDEQRREWHRMQYGRDGNRM